MNRVVWKFPLRPWFASLDMPKGAQILHVAAQGRDEICLWALCDPKAPKVSRYLVAVPTGDGPSNDALTYIGTAHLPGPLVFHVFDGGERS